MKGFICKCLYRNKLSTEYVLSGINNYWKIEKLLDKCTESTSVIFNWLFGCLHYNMALLPWQ